MSRVVELEQIEDENVVDLNSEETEETGEVKEEVKEEEALHNLPEKFKGKSIADIVEAYTNLEREFGRKSNEVGELRQLTDRILELELSGKGDKKANKKVIDADSLLENPEQVLDDAISNHPSVKAANDRLTKSELRERKESFEKQHSDWRDVVGSTEFQEWILASPTRTRLFKEADKAYDYDTGAELLSLYKETHKKTEAAPEQSKENKAKRDKALKDAASEGKSEGAPSKKIYRRSDLINLRMRDRAKFDSMNDELTLAYKEGRVR